MPSWRYKVTVHSADDILQHLTHMVDDVPPAIYCDDQGACYFDDGRNHLTEGIARLLTEIGDEAWELVQVAFRPHQMICFWKQPR